MRPPDRGLCRTIRCYGPYREFPTPVPGLCHTLSGQGFWFTHCGLQSFLYDNDEYFSVPGWRLDTSWILCTVSASVAAVLVGALASCAYFLPPEDDGYNFLDDPIDV